MRQPWSQGSPSYLHRQLLLFSLICRAASQTLMGLISHPTWHLRVPEPPKFWLQPQGRVATRSTAMPPANAFHNKANIFLVVLLVIFCPVKAMLENYPKLPYVRKGALGNFPRSLEKPGCNGDFYISNGII